MGSDVPQQLVLVVVTGVVALAAAWPAQATFIVSSDPAWRPRPRSRRP
jgi:hypothetical protein